VIEQARRVLEEAEMIKTLAAADQDQLAAPLKLGVIYTVGPYLIPGLIPGIRAAAPKMQLRIAENFTDAFSERLKVGDLDAAILSLPYQSAGIIRVLYDEPFVVALPRGHRRLHFSPRRSSAVRHLPYA
jgi:LysR family hydrogen peroxide-inducible transcriptional activator